MLYFIIAIIIVFIIKFIYDKYMLEENIKSEGGIKLKYKILITELTNSHTPIYHEHRDHVMINIPTESGTYSYMLLPAFNNLIVEVNYLGANNKSFENKWTFDLGNYDQKLMGKSIRLYCDSMLELLNTNNEKLPFKNPSWLEESYKTNRNGKKENLNINYLTNSRVKEFQDNLLFDTLDIYCEKLGEDENPREIKDLINNFLLKDEISFIKFSINLEFYNAGYKHSDYERFSDSQFVAPSLLKIVNTGKMQIRLYPSWFYQAFPDVILWATENRGANIEFLSKKYVDEYIENNKVELLQEIIEVYLREFDFLECTVHYNKLSL